MAIKKHTIIKWLQATLWVSLGAGAIVLLVAAVQKKNTDSCKGVAVNIKGVNNNFFVDKKDILDSLTMIEGGNPIGKRINTFNLEMMETKLRKNVWVKKAELFFDNNNTLQVNITEREPVARIFSNSGATFYIDTSNAILPLSEKFSARLPVFTGFPSDKILSKADSSLLKDVQTVSLALQKDSFCMAMIDQVEITPQRTFEMTPKIGDNTIVFGDASSAAIKLKKLKVFYEQVIIKSGWNYYSQINVQYQDQVVAKKRGADDKSADSLSTLQMMQQIAINAERAANDSLQIIAADNDNNTTDVNLIQQSIQRDDDEDGSTKGADAWVPKPVAIKPAPVEKPTNYKIPNSKPITKPISNKPISKETKKPTKPTTNKPVNKETKKPVNPKPYTQQPKTGMQAPKPVDIKPKPVQKPAVVKPKPVQTGKPIKTNNDY